MTFKKGQSGNPSKRFTSDNQPAKNGRPKKMPELEVIIAEALGESKDGLPTVAHKVISKITDMALKGNLRAAELLLAYAYGRPKQQIDHTTDNQPIKPPATIVFVQGDG